MPKFMIERTMPGAGSLSDDELGAASRKCNQVLAELAPQVQWQQHSYFTDDKVFCVYVAEDEAVIQEHARRGEFPVDAINRVTALTDPATAES